MGIKMNEQERMMNERMNEQDKMMNARMNEQDEMMNVRMNADLNVIITGRMNKEKNGNVNE